MIFTLPQLWLQFYTGFSGTNYYDDWYYMGYNSFLTAFPVAFQAMVNEDIDIEFKFYPNKEILKL